MPRYSINLDPFARPVTPESDALTTAVAQVTAAIQRRREMESDREERDLVRGEQRADRDLIRQRQDRMEALSLEDRDYRRKQDDHRLTIETEDRGIRAQDRQLRTERDASQDLRQSDRDAIDLFKMNEDMDYRDRQAAERQIQQMNIDDTRRDATTSREQSKQRLTFKEARSLALDEAKARTGKDAMGNVRPVDPKLIDDLTQQFLDTGDAVRPNQRVSDPEVQREVFDVLNPPTASAPTIAPSAPVAAAPANEDPGILASIGKWGMKALPWPLNSYLDEPAAPAAAGATPPDVAPPNAPDPDPKYIDQMEQLSAVNPENFKKILRELKDKHPGEYAATVRMLTERETSKRVASAQ